MPGSPRHGSSVDQQLARLLPLLPQLAMGIQRRRGAVPEELQAVGGLGPRHVAALVSLAVVGPASVSELAGRLDMTLTHASLVLGELGRADLLVRTPDPDDRRRVIVSVVPGRAQQIQQTAGRAALPIRGFLASLSEPEADLFVSQLAELAHVLVEMQPPPEHPV